MKWPLLWPLVALQLLLTASIHAIDFTTYHHEDVHNKADLDQSHVGMSSLTFVFDRTGSMFDDLDQVRRGTEGIFNTVMKQRKRFIYNYVLVMFHDPGTFALAEPCPFEAVFFINFSLLKMGENGKFEIFE